MPKALLNNKDSFFYFKDKGLGVWHPEFVQDIVELANEGRKFAEDTETYPDFDVEQAFRATLYYWVNRYWKASKRISDDFANDLNKELVSVRYTKHLFPFDDGGCKFVFVADLSSHEGNPYVAGAEEFSKVLASYGLDGLRRCRRESCELFFLGRSNQDFCSKTCGSNFRVSKKRKSDRHRQKI